MSRIAKNPVSLPGGTEVTINETTIVAKGPNGELTMNKHPLVAVNQEDGVLKIAANDDSATAIAMSGTTRALLSNLVTGVSKGFEKKLTIIGVGYRAKVQGKSLNLSLGFSHPVVYAIPDGITIEAPSQTELVIKGADKQKVGQVAAEIRHYRPPEPYKGKGVRYSDEYVVRKQAKKK
ncbi:MAG: 50S ribosomal protein L6 [Pseudomonadota bacterium]|nr:50S ribosomal protein L6 [Pseudomonadota bacterium]